MPRPEPSSELRELQQIIENHGGGPRAPQPIAEVLARLMARRGYGHIQTAHDWSEVWKDLAGNLATHSRVGKFSRGVLDIVVRNSAMMQELTFRKKALLQGLQQQRPDARLKDLRFRVGPLE